MERADNKPLEEKVSVFILKRVASFTQNENGTLALEPDFSTPLQTGPKPAKIDLTAPSLAELINAKTADAFCQSAAKDLKRVCTEITFNKDGVHVRRAYIGGSLQMFVQQSLRQRTFALSQYSLLSGHPRQQHMYRTTRPECFGPDMARDVYNTVSSCESSAKSSSDSNHRLRHRLFPAAYICEIGATDISDLLSETTTGTRLVVITTRRYSKFTRAISTALTTTNSAAENFFFSWVVLYGILLYHLTDNCNQFVSNFSETLCNDLDSMHITSTVYHTRTNGQVERYSSTVVCRLQQFVASHQRDRDQVVEPLTNTYNVQVRGSTNTMPISLVIMRQPPIPAISDTPSALPTDAYHETHTRPLRKQLLNRHQALRCLVDGRLRTAQSWYKRYFDAKVRHLQTFISGQMGFIDRPPVAAALSGNADEWA